jgi:hypothetical protein
MLSIHLISIVCTLKVVNAFTKCNFKIHELGCDEETNTFCNNSTQNCICKPNYSIKLENGICLQSVSIDGECMVSQECSLIPNAKCLTVDGIELRYDQFKHFGSKIWQISRKLVKDKFGVLGFCKCKQSYQYDRQKNQCIYKVIGSACSHHKHCSKLVTNSECHSGLCNCQISHYHLNDTCLLKKNLIDFCSNSFQCKSNLYCSQSSRCECRKNYEFNEQSSECQYKSYNEVNTLNASSNANGRLWDDIAKVGGFLIIVIVMLFLCTKKESEQKQTQNNRSVRRRSTSFSRTHRRRSSSVNSHRPLCQTPSNASRTSAYKTFEDNRQTIIIPMPIQMVHSMSSSSDEIEYNPYLFDALFPQQSDNDDPPSYEDAIKEMDHH